MTVEMGCEQVRDLAPELALGIAEGEERDAALRHLSDCAGCRKLVSELSAVGDELLLMAPVHEPPLGFEARVLTAVTRPPKRQRRQTPAFRRKWVAAASAAAVLAAGFGVGSMFLATADDRRLADSYRAVLSQGDGSFFEAASFQGPQGRAGTVFGYEGQPSWVMVTLAPSIRADGQFKAQVVTRDGRYLPVGDAVLGGAGAAWGGRLPVDLSQVRELRFLGPNGRKVYTATFDGASPWE